MPAYPDHPNNDLLERIPLSATVVLDVGCNTGALGAAYRRLNPRARLLGIEQDPEAAEVATQRLDQVAVVDVEQDPMPFTLDRPIDCCAAPGNTSRRACSTRRICAGSASRRCVRASRRRALRRTMSRRACPI